MHRPLDVWHMILFPDFDSILTASTISYACSAFFGVIRQRSHILTSAKMRGRGFINADATVILIVCPSVQLLTEGGGERGRKSAKFAEVICECSLTENPCITKKL